MPGTASKSTSNPIQKTDQQPEERERSERLEVIEPKPTTDLNRVMTKASP